MLSALLELLLGKAVDLSALLVIYNFIQSNWKEND